MMYLKMHFFTLSTKLKPFLKYDDGENRVVEIRNKCSQ